MNARNPAFVRIGADSRDVLANDYANLTAQLTALTETLNSLRAKGVLITDPTYKAVLDDINQKEAQRKRIKAQLDENPRPPPAPGTVVTAPTPDAWITQWQALLTNYGRLQPFKPQVPLNPGANPLVTGFLDDATKAATVQFQKDFGYPVDGVPKFEYADVLNGLKPGPNAVAAASKPGNATTTTTTPGAGGAPVTPINESSKPMQALTVAGLLSPIVLVWWLTR